MSEYRVDLEVFSGPLDLLLYLVRKDEVDVYDIPIARITGQYLHYIEMLKMLDIDVAGDFLVMAATLMEIKSAMLLPRTEEQEGDEGEMDDPRKELVRQLLEYKKFKDAAGVLASKAEQRSEKFTRPDSIISELKDQQEPEVDMDQVSIWTLLEAFEKLMEATGNLASYENIKDDTPIDLYQIEILHRLQSEGPATFEDIFKNRESKLVMVGLFLALLELMRDQLISAEQREGNEAIYLRALTSEPAEEAVKNAIISSAAEEENAQDSVNTSTDEETETSVQDAEPAEETEPPLPEQSEPQQEKQPAKPRIPIVELPARRKAQNPEYESAGQTDSSQTQRDE